MIQGKWYAPEEPVPESMRKIREQVFGSGGDDADPASWKALVFTDGIGGDRTDLVAGRQLLAGLDRSASAVPA